MSAPATAAALEQIRDPFDRLRALRVVREATAELDDHLADLARTTIAAARAADPRPTWAELGAALGVSAQRAAQLGEPKGTPE